MGASIDTTALVGASRRLDAITRGGLQKECAKALHDAAPKIVLDIKGAATSKIERRAAGSVEMSRDAQGITLRGGFGVGLSATLFPGGEYGGRKSKKSKPYRSTSRTGNPYWLLRGRRTTMQFKPWLGHEGHFFWPTIREWYPKLVKEQEAIIEKAMGGR